MTLTFNSAVDRLIVPVRIVDDSVDEENEQLLARLMLEPIAGDLPSVQVDPAQATLLIIDNDRKLRVPCIARIVHNPIISYNYRHHNRN